MVTAAECGDFASRPARIIRMVPLGGNFRQAHKGEIETVGGCQEYSVRQRHRVDAVAAIALRRLVSEIKYRTFRIGSMPDAMICRQKIGNAIVLHIVDQGSGAKFSIRSDENPADGILDHLPVGPQRAVNVDIAAPRASITRALRAVEHIDKGCGHRPDPDIIRSLDPY